MRKLRDSSALFETKVAELRLEFCSISERWINNYGSDRDTEENFATVTITYKLHVSKVCGTKGYSILQSSPCPLGTP